MAKRSIYRKKKKKDGCIIINRDDWEIFDKKYEGAYGYMITITQWHSVRHWQGWLNAFGGYKAKIDYFVLDAKLLLINMNYVEFFFFFF